eukprot:396187-Amphidinium_carterae.2
MNRSHMPLLCSLKLGGGASAPHQASAICYHRSGETTSRAAFGQLARLPHLLAERTRPGLRMRNQHGNLLLVSVLAKEGVCAELSFEAGRFLPKCANSTFCAGP